MEARWERRFCSMRWKMIPQIFGLVVDPWPGPKRGISGVFRYVVDYRPYAVWT